MFFQTVGKANPASQGFHKASDKTGKPDTPPLSRKRVWRPLGAAKLTAGSNLIALVGRDVKEYEAAMKG